MVESVFHDVIKMQMSAKIFLYILKAYIIVYIIKNFCDSSFSKSNVNAWEGWQFCLPQPKSEVKKPTQNCLLTHPLLITQYTSWYFISSSVSSIRPEVFSEKDSLRNLTKFTGKTPALETFFSKVKGLTLQI